MNRFLLTATVLFIYCSSFGQSVEFGFDIGNTTSSAQSETGYKVTLDASDNVYVTGAFYGTSVDFDPSGSNLKSSNGDSDIFVAKYNSSGALQWVVTFGGTGEDVGLDIATDGTDVFITGTLNQGDGSAISVNGTNVTPQGDRDFFLAKFSATDGTTGFAFSVGAGAGQLIPGISSGIGIVLNGSNVYAVGVASYSFTAPSTVNHYDFDANNVATTDTIIPTTPETISIPVDPNELNNFFDLFIVSYAKSDGSFNWVESIGSQYEDVATDITTDGTDLYVTGSISNTTNFDTDGSGARNLTVNSKDNKDMFFAKFNTSGVDQWAYSMGSNSTDAGADAYTGESAASIVSDGTNIYISGNYRGTVDMDPKGGSGQNVTNVGGDDFFIASYDNTGTHRWSYGFGGTGNDYANAIAVGGSGTALNVFLAGQFQSSFDFDPTGNTNTKTSAGSEDFYVSEFSTSGSYVATFTAGSSNEDVISGLAVSTPSTSNTRGQAYVTGFFESTVDFDPSSSSTTSLSTTGSSDRDIFLVKYNENALPVELLNFDVKAVDNSVELEWRTAVELNNEGFEVLRSTDSQDWEALDFVLGNGTTNEIQEYFFVDEAPKEGINYYRLKQMDYDGTTAYSDIKSVFYGQSSIKSPVSIFPNPVADNLHLINGQGQVTVFNQLGQPLKEFVIIENQVVIDVSDLVKGNYLLQIQHLDGTTEMKRFVK